MGIDYRTCVCGENFPDCDATWCEDCGTAFCSNECSGCTNNEDENGEEVYGCCVVCREENTSDSELLDALMKHYKLTRDQALEIWRGEDK